MKNKYEIRGDKVAIFLNRRDGLKLETIIDLNELPKVQSFDGKWYATTKKNLDCFYVNGIYTGTDKTIYLHRFILDAPKGFHVDHINHDTLDNTKENLRVTTPAQNLQNRKINKNNQSGERGVLFNKKINKWKVSIRVRGGARFERFFDNREDAVNAARKARMVYMPFTVEEVPDLINYSEEDLLKEYPRYHHDKKKVGRNSKSGHLGVHWHKRSERWQAAIRIEGKQQYLGSFKNKIEAIEAVTLAQRQ